MNNTLILDGNAVAKEIKEGLIPRISFLKKSGVTPCLAAILVGDDPSSRTYVQMKRNACHRLGIDSHFIHLPEITDTHTLINSIDELNDDISIHGILLQHPVPNHIDERAAFERIGIEKDVDGVTSLGFGQTSLGVGLFAPCTPAAILAILEYYKIPLEGKNAVVIGRSPILGKPVSMLMLNRNATVTICHSKTSNLTELVGQADIVVAAAGVPHLVNGSWIKEGSIILDAGYNEGNIGDVDFDSCVSRASAITPVPGGVGPVTIATLLKHTVEAAERQLNKGYPGKNAVNG